MRFLKPLTPLIIVVLCLLVVTVVVAGRDQYPWVQWALIIASVLLILGLSIQLLRDANKPYMRLKVSNVGRKK